MLYHINEKCVVKRDNTDIFLIDKITIFYIFQRVDQINQGWCDNYSFTPYSLIHFVLNQVQTLKLAPQINL